MNLGLKGKVAIVMASSKGLGKATALSLAMEGAHVVIGAREEKTLQETAREIEKQSGNKILSIPTSAIKQEDLKNIVEQTIKKFGKVDILVNNAGGPPTGKFEATGDEQWEKAFELNLMSAVHLIRLVLPSMKKQKSGRIINIVSTSVKQPIENLLLSNSIRTAVVGMAKTLSDEFAQYNITVNNICPGRFLTDRIRQLYNLDEKMKSGLTQEEALQDAVKDIPMKRIGKPEELGALITFLASEQAAYITGTTIQVDGGLVRSLL